MVYRSRLQEGMIGVFDSLDSLCRGLGSGHGECPVLEQKISALGGSLQKLRNVKYRLF